jgi:hypothetical protein
MKVEDLRPRGAGWTVQLHEKGGKELRVPRVDVEFVFQRYELADSNAFMSRFHAHFRRGGG